MTLKEKINAANQHGYKAEYNEAIHLANEVLSETTDPAFICEGMLILGVISLRKNQLDEALEHLFKLIPLAEQIGNDALMAKAYGNIGMVHHKRSEYSEALEYFTKSCAIEEQLGNQSALAKLWSNLGNVYLELSEYNRALEYYQKALPVFEETNFKYGVSGTLHNIGHIYQKITEYATALEYYRKALVINTKHGYKQFTAHNLGNIGIVYSSMSDYRQALQYYQQALELCESIDDKPSIATQYGNIGVVYENIKDYQRAFEYKNKALELYQQLGNKFGVALQMSNIGNIKLSLGELDVAKDYLQTALEMHEELGNKHGIAHTTGQLGKTFYYLHNYTASIDLYTIASSGCLELGDLHGFGTWQYQLGVALSNTDNINRNETLAESHLLEAVRIFKEINNRRDLYETYLALAGLYKTLQRWQECAEYYEMFHVLKEDVVSEETTQIALRFDAERKSAEQEKQIAIERTRYQERESILNNILPEEITSRLIAGENPIADHFDSVSILFMDIVEFTSLSATISAQQLVYLLNAIFTAADGVIREFGLEKIKTIGDAYMAVAGAPIVQEDHAERAAQAALKLLEVMQNLMVDFPENYGDRSWIESIPEIQVRIGLHCGPAAAGVVGENKFLYDLWGDAVNTASRMESHGAAGKIHCSADFMRAVETVHAASLRFIPRGEMEIKGKGIMTTYFLEKV
ncbi:MAG: tetratricopeptide repeat protein [Candidatus Kapabacteria bacterium]|nr:tetratricopeptide repeat protein [Candidatus Kapabacteria bacterium]